jgi:hypothetical protein
LGNRHFLRAHGRAAVSGQWASSSSCGLVETNFCR